MPIVIIVTHNANLVIKTDADQIIVASAGPHPSGGLPPISYVAGGLEVYYETLYKLGRDAFEPYFRGLRDVAFDDEFKASVEDTEAYRVWMLRFGGAERTITVRCLVTCPAFASRS